MTRLAFLALVVLGCAREPRAPVASPAATPSTETVQRSSPIRISGAPAWGVLEPRIATFPDELRGSCIARRSQPVTLRRENVGAFAIVFASLVAPASERRTTCFSALVFTAEGNTDARGNAVIGRADFDGDGREDLVLRDERMDRLANPSSVSFIDVIADRPGGPISLGIDYLGDMSGFTVIDVTSHRGRPAIHVVTRGRGMGEAAGPPSPSEDVVLQWNGEVLAVAPR